MAVRKVSRRYLDSVCMIRFLEGADGAQDVARILSEAAAGGFQVILNAISMLEISRPPNARLDTTRWAKVQSFFESDFLTVVDFDVPLAEKSQDLMVDFPWLHPKDAGHLATAIATDCECFYTYEEQLTTRFNGQRGLIVGPPGIAISKPLNELPLFTNTLDDYLSID